MSEDLKTNGYAVDCIENEGTGYAVQHYISGSKFKDPETARLWTLAAETLDALEAHLREETGRDF